MNILNDLMTVSDVWCVKGQFSALEVELALSVINIKSFCPNQCDKALVPSEGHIGVWR